MGTDYWEDVLKVDCGKRAVDFFFKKVESLDLSDAELNAFREESAIPRQFLLLISMVYEKLELITDPMERRRGNELRIVIRHTLNFHNRCVDNKNAGVEQ